MSARTAAVGPFALEVYPLKAFSRMPPGVKVEEVWKLIGPTVDANLQKFPLWQVFAICYYEGLQHGVASMVKEHAREGKSSVDAPDAKPSASQPGATGTENSTT